MKIVGKRNVFVNSVPIIENEVLEVSEDTAQKAFKLKAAVPFTEKNNPLQQAPIEQVIAKIKAAKTAEEIDTIIAGEIRAAVVKVAEDAKKSLIPAGLPLFGFNVKEANEKIMACKTIEEVEALVKGETRVTILKAAEDMKTLLKEA